MRAREILQEDYQQSLVSDLQNLLVGAMGSGAKELRTSDLVSQMRDMGYSVSPNSIMAVLNNMPMVSNSTPQMINLVEPESTDMEGEAGEEDDSAEQVKAMAQQATDKADNDLGL
jgi:hypothetical protein